MIRGFFIILECITLPMVSLILAPITLIINIFSKEKAQAIAQLLVKLYAKCTLFICGTKLEVIGLENIPNEPCLYISNHRSYFDIIITITLIKKKSFYIAKKDLEKIPVFNFWLRKMGTLLIDRNDLKQSLNVIINAIDKVKNGYSCFIYPEGTRTKDADHKMLPFKEGSFKIATKTGCPICPITMINPRAIYENQAPRFKRATVKVIISKPIYPDTLDKEDKKHIGNYTQKIIEENINKYL